MSRPPRPALLFPLFLAALLLLSLPAPVQGDGPLKVDPSLARPAGEASRGLIRRDASGKVQIYVHYDLSLAGGDPAGPLEDLGMAVELVSPMLGVVQGWLDPGLLGDAASLPFVTRITRPSYGTINAGPTTSEGVSIHRAGVVHGLGFDGGGLTVGVISDGADSYQAAQTAGDLPAALTLYGTCTAPTACDEGTAMLEIVNDMAPGADLAFCAGLNTTAEFLQCLADLTGHGVQVIVDDVIFYEEPYFSDGVLAQSVQALLGSVVYVTSAGNDSLSHYESPKTGGGFEHDFGLASGGAP
ncbi:MAG: hypothetical protein JSV00_03740, partial [bacterium]